MALISRSAAVCALALAALAAPAMAGPPGTWTQVTNFSAQGSNADEVSVARLPNGTLNVLWVLDTAVQNTQVSADGADVLGTHTVFVYGGGGANNNTALLRAGGGLRAFFSGLISSDENHDGGMSTATSADGISWNVQPTLASQSDGAGNEESPVYAAAGIGGTSFTNGAPLSIWGDSAPGAAGYHVGTSQSTPDVRISSGASVGSPGAATDSATGQVAVGWSDLDTGQVKVAFVQPTTSPWFPLGAVVIPPGANAADALYPVGMTGRSGGAGGIYVSYLRGTNQFSSQPAIWRIGAPTAVDLTGGEARYPGVTMGPGGRLWAFWEDDNTAQIHARRSNAAADAWGADVAIAPPGDTTWSLKGEGSAVSCGALDIVALADAGGTTANYHQRVLAGLDLKKKILNGGRGVKEKVRFTVLDAGDPVDATVKFGKAKKATGDDGKVNIKIRRKQKTRKVKANAAAECFASDQLKVKVKKFRNG